MIDKNNGSGYAPELLAAWRDLHEARIAWELDGVAAPFGWIESLTVHEAPLMAGTEIRFGKCTLLIGGTGAGKTAILEWLSGLMRPANLARWATDVGFRVGSAGVEVSVRYYHPNPSSIRYSAKDGVIMFSSKEGRVPVPVSPFQIVEVRHAGRHGRTAAEVLADWTGEHAMLLPGILQAYSSTAWSLFDETRVEGGEVVLRRRGESRPIRFDALSGGEQMRLKFGVATTVAAAKAAQAPTILLLDDVIGSVDPETAHAIALDLQRPENRFQTVMTSFNVRAPIPEIAWEVIAVHRDGAEPVRSSFLPTSLVTDSDT